MNLKILTAIITKTHDEYQVHNDNSGQYNTDYGNKN